MREDSGLEIVGPAGRRTSLSRRGRNPEPIDFSFALRATVIPKLEILSLLIPSKILPRGASSRITRAGLFPSAARCCGRNGVDIPDEVPAGSMSGYTARFLACYG